MRVISIVLLLLLSFSSFAEITGDFKCKSALQGFDTNHKKMAKLANEIGKSSTMKKSKAREIIDTLKTAIQYGETSLKLCNITGQDRVEFDGFHNMAKSTLAFYESQGLVDKI